jgi:hypothetical protein
MSLSQHMLRTKAYDLCSTALVALPPRCTAENGQKKFWYIIIYNAKKRLVNNSFAKYLPLP